MDTKYENYLALTLLTLTKYASARDTTTRNNWFHYNYIVTKNFIYSCLKFTYRPPIIKITNYIDLLFIFIKK